MIFLKFGVNLSTIRGVTPLLLRVDIFLSVNPMYFEKGPLKEWPVSRVDIFGPKMKAQLGTNFSRKILLRFFLKSHKS